MTNHNFPSPVETIANDYLDRVRRHLRGLSDTDRDELIWELHSHIYESYQQEAGDDAVARILAVLRRLGEPADVIQDRMAGAVSDLGRKRRLPLYILGGVFMVLIGFPLGFGGLAVAIWLLAAVLGFLVAYFATGICMVVTGSLGIVLGLVQMYHPELITQINQAFNQEVISLGPLSPQWAGVVILAGSIILTALGLGWLWLGKRMARGLRFLGCLLWDRGQRLWQRHRPRFQAASTDPVEPEAAASGEREESSPQQLPNQ